MIRLLLAALFCTLSPLAAAQQAPIVGTWEGADRAAQSIYGTMKVSASGLAWGGHVRHYPPCRASYTIVPEPDGVQFKDQTDRAYVTSANSPFKTWLLRLKGGKCTNGVAQMRMTITDEAPAELAVIEYRDNGDPVGWMHFTRR